MNPWQQMAVAPTNLIVEVRHPTRHPIPCRAELVGGEWWAEGQLGLMLAWQPTEWRAVEDDGYPTCRWGDGPCRYRERCYRAERCLGAD